MTVFVLLAGVLIAAPVFAATLWSLAQIIRQRGRLRWAHVFVLVATLMAMSALSFENPLFVTVTGGVLVLAGAFTVYADTGWNRVLPLFQLAFGFALFAGLPFLGG